VAIRGPGDDRRVRLGRNRNHSLQPCRRYPARTLEAAGVDMQGENLSALHQSISGFWVRQKSNDGAAIINA
jgi:hypothetical protein